VNIRFEYNIVPVIFDRHDSVSDVSDSNGPRY